MSTARYLSALRLARADRMSLFPPRDYADKLADACGEGCDSDTANDYAGSAVPLQRFMTTTTEQEPELAPAEQPAETPKPAELVKLELVVAESGVELATAQGLVESFAPIFREVHALLEKAKTAPPVTDATQLNEMKACRELRLALAKLRVAGDKLREKLKRDSLLRGNAVQGVYNLLKFMVEPIETHLEMKEKFAERAQAARLAAVKAERTALLAPYCDPLQGSPIFNVENMDEKAFGVLLETMKSGYEARQAADAKREADRVAAVKAEAERIEAQRLENERLKKEAAEREAAAHNEREAAAAALAKEREEAARLAREAQAKADAAAKKLREEAAESARVADERAKAEAARVQKEREAIEAKAKAGREALEARAREERQAREIAEAKLAEKAQQEEISRLAKLEAEEKAALAPDKEKLKAYAASILALVIPKLSTPKAADVFAEIAVQRDKFAAWIDKKAEAL